MSVLLLILGLALFVMLVVVHEFGHFILARHNNVDVEEFGIGFPPRAWGRRLKSGLLLSVNWLPLGGFVRLKGEHDADTDKGSFGAANLKAKSKILLAGVSMNLLTAFSLFTILAWLGIPKLIDNQFTIKRDTKVTSDRVMVAEVEPNSPAQKAGIKLRDQLLSIRRPNGQTDVITSAEALPHITKADAGQHVQVQIERDGNELTRTVTLRSAKEVSTSQNKGYLGIAPAEYSLQKSTWSAPVTGAGLLVQLTTLSFKGLGVVVKGLGSFVAGLLTHNHAAREAGQTKASQNVAGPLGIFYILRDSSLLGYQFILMIVAVISLTLAIMNALPIPALDGGRLFVILVYRTMRRPLKPKTEDRIHGTGFLVLLALVVLITIIDFRRMH
jgi:regulator of sigma E protease